ncbi:hypothetical protein [Providencia stuartii]|uniref:hypothetical protein n=1 Tax=Providencia stuartii TaxID=588 RepID=UPI0034E3CC65
MPVPPNPFVYRCTACDWHKVVTPKSDNHVVGYDCFNECPKCGCDTLKRSPASAYDIIASWFK